MSSLSQLIPLLPSTPYLLAYTLPLLLISLILSFAGTFLTLDRSRSFPPQGTGKAYTSLAIPGALDGPKTKRKLSWALEGGAGGLMGGFVFGVHLSTVLALLIPVTTASASLSPKSFLAIWILSSIVTTPLAGRYRYVAYLFFGVSGGTMTSLALCVIVHPSLHSRVVLISVFLPLFSILVLILASIPRLSNAFFHPFLRICTASTGAFGVILSIALLLHPQQSGWANVWERLWTKDGEGWGTAREQGLSAAFFVFFAAGIAVDWALKRWIGECPDEKWDNYLAHYAANLPNRADRAGTFQPLTSFWDRIFPSSSAPSTPFGYPNHKKGGSKDILFPNEVDLKNHLPLPLPVTMHNMGPGKLSKKDSKSNEDQVLLQPIPTRAETLKKSRQKGFAAWRKRGDRIVSGARKPVKFGADLSSDDDSDDDEENTKKNPSSPSTPTMQYKRPNGRPFALGQQPPSESYSSSTPTLVEGRVERARQERRKDSKLEALATLDYEKEIESVKDKLRPKGQKGGNADEEVDYSDYEEDLSALKGKADVTSGGEQWSPAFLKRHQSQSLSTTTPPLVAPGAVPVPATPSLIRAIDRIAVAQRDAYGFPAVNTSHQSPSQATSIPKDARGDLDALVNMEAGAKKEKDRAPRWEEFWREVRQKAQA